MDKLKLFLGEYSSESEEHADRFMSLDPDARFQVERFILL